MNINEEKVRNMISVYAPDISKDRDEEEQFYADLQAHIVTTNRQEKLMIMGDLNARIANEELTNITQRFNQEET